MGPNILMPPSTTQILDFEKAPNGAKEKEPIRHHFDGVKSAAGGAWQPTMKRHETAVIDMPAPLCFRVLLHRRRLAASSPLSHAAVLRFPRVCVCVCVRTRAALSGRRCPVWRVPECNSP